MGFSDWKYLKAPSFETKVFHIVTVAATENSMLSILSRSPALEIPEAPWLTPVQKWFTRQIKYQPINKIRVCPSYCYTYLALSWVGTEHVETQKRVTI